MQNIKFSKQIYQKNILEGIIHILNDRSNVSEKQIYPINTPRPIMPEIPALLMRMGFDLGIFLSNGDDCIKSTLWIFGKNCNMQGEIKRISNCGRPDEERQEQYRAQVMDYLNSKECDEVLKMVEENLG